MVAGCSALEEIGLSQPAAESGSMPETGPACSLLVLTLLVFATPPSVRSVVWLAERLWRFACRRASDPSVFLAMVAGDAGRLNGRASAVGVGELARGERVAARQLLWHAPDCDLGGTGGKKGVWK